MSRTIKLLAAIGALSLAPAVFAQGGGAAGGAASAGGTTVVTTVTVAVVTAAAIGVIVETATNDAKTPTATTSTTP